jgi:ATP-dependent Clp protease ATP-binding subunit ClpB
MDINNFTIKAQEAIAKAQEIAIGNQHQGIENAHLLKALLVTDENVVSHLIKRFGVNTNVLLQKTEAIISSFPKVSGGNAYFSKDANQTLQNALKFKKDFNDDFVSVEHILLGILKTSGKESNLLKESGLSEKELIQAIKDLRKGEKVSDQNAEAKYNALSKYAKNLNELVMAGKMIR